jgi:anaerobic selenocysteine-containing dehydrogenase
MDAGPVSARGKTAGRETLAISPADACERGIGDGEVVRVFNDRGACFAGVVITDAVRPGLFDCLAALGMTRPAMTTMHPARMATRMY